MSVENLLQIDGLTKRWPGFSLEDVSFAVPKGSVVGLIGENGAGKTTTVNLILNAVERDAGRVLVFGKDNIRCEREIKQSVGVVQDECNLPLMFTSGDIESVMRRIYKNWDSHRYRELTDRFDLPCTLPISAYSKGMKVKLNFAIALAHRSRLLIMDEATGSLDPVMRDDVLDLILDFVQEEENGVLFSTHLTADLTRIADYVAFLHGGRLLFFKPKDELIYRYGLVHCGEKLFRQMDASDMLAWRRLDYEYRVLVEDRDRISRRYRDCVVDPATLDDIMLMYIRGERT